ncbi:MULTISPECIES: restriction endonuclease subunit S [unclassified Aeromonas]|uniref:restriction endonuclease subunit S n=1 Tax=unclassified Aeromonas TaxID=257493 RepID=UPI0035288E8C
MNLNQIATISAGHPFRGKIPEFDSGSMAVVQMRDASPEAGVDWSACLRTEPTSKKEPDWLQTGDILVAARGSTNYAVLVDIRHAPLPAVAAPHFYVVRLQSEAHSPEFLAWQLNQIPCQRYFELHAEGSMSKSIRRQVLEETPIGIPSLTRQQAIMNMVNTLREERRLMQQLQRNGEQMMHAIAASLLEQPDQPAVRLAGNSQA